MYGSDIEKMLRQIDSTKKLIEDTIDDIGDELGNPWSSDANLSKKTNLQKTMKKLDDLEDYCQKMDKMDKKLYVNKSECNNSIGSPWTEFAKLKIGLKDAGDFYDKWPTLKYANQKSAMLAFLNAVLTEATDAKWALVTYHDFTQRGFDNMFNNNKPSMTFPNGVDGEQTTGNLDQEVDNNVSIKKKSIDPY